MTKVAVIEMDDDFYATVLRYVYIAQQTDQWRPGERPLQQIIASLVASVEEDCIAVIEKNPKPGTVLVAKDG